MYINDRMGGDKAQRLGSPESFKPGVQPFQFDTGAFGRELPVGFGVAFVSIAFPGRDFFLEGLLVGDAAAQALGGQNGEFGLGHVEPASVLWRAMPFEPVDEAARFGGRKGGVERGRRMRAEIVLDQHDFFRGGELHVG